MGRVHTLALTWLAEDMVVSRQIMPPIPRCPRPNPGAPARVTTRSKKDFANMVTLWMVRGEMILVIQVGTTNHSSPSKREKKEEDQGQCDLPQQLIQIPEDSQSKASSCPANRHRSGPIPAKARTSADSARNPTCEAWSPCSHFAIVRGVTNEGSKRITVREAEA